LPRLKLSRRARPSPTAWAVVVDELRDFGDAYASRRIREATRIETIPGVPSPPPLVLLHGTDLGLSGLGFTVSYSTPIADALTEYAFDPPPGEVYTIAEDLGSPGFTSIQLPASSADSYSVTYEIAGIWSTPQIARPMEILSLPRGVDSLTVSLLDEDGAPEVARSSFSFYATFDSEGVFSGTVTTSSAPCFCLGTHIATPSGEVLVDALSMGDVVCTSLSGTAPVKWIGHRHIDCRKHSDPRKVWPIRVCAGAFEKDVPHRDLWLSPDHAVFVGGVLVPIKQLVNGSSIRQVETGEVTYFHVELERHDILLAEGLAAESYLDTGNRVAFQNARIPIALHPDFSRISRPTDLRAGACAPLAVLAGQVETIWRRLATRAAALGRPVSQPSATTDPQLRLSIAGREMKAVLATEDRYVFIVPSWTHKVHITSRTTAPSDLWPWLDDRRRLGVSVGRITLHNGVDLTDVPMDHPSLVEGWHGVERDGRRQWRWTDGSAQLRLPMGTTMIEFRLASLNEYAIYAASNAAKLAA